MKLKSITLSRTQNLGNYGNYQSRRFEATVELEAGDVASAAVQRLRRFVDGSLASLDVSEEHLREAKRVFDEAHATLSEVKLFDGETLGARCVPDDEEPPAEAWISADEKVSRELPKGKAADGGSDILSDPEASQGMTGNKGGGITE